MNSFSPVQHVPTTPSLRHHEHDWWESPSAIVPETGDPLNNPGTPAVLVPRTPQHSFPRSPWSTPLREGRGTSTTFITPLSSTTPTFTPLSRTTPTPFPRTIFHHAPNHGITPVYPMTPSRDRCCKNFRQASHMGEEQIVPSTPKLDEAATLSSQARISTTEDRRRGPGSRTPRVLLSPQVPFTSYRYLDLFSGDDYFD